MDTNRKSERKGVRVSASKFASCTTIANKQANEVVLALGKTKTEQQGYL